MDEWNCGVFACLFAEKLMKGQNMSFIFNAKEDREHLRATIRNLKMKDELRMRLEFSGEIKIDEIDMITTDFLVKTINYTAFQKNMIAL